jgi:putative nucleotidyltransferase with HDIG domain
MNTQQKLELTPIVVTNRSRFNSKFVVQLHVKGEFRLLNVRYQQELNRAELQLYGFDRHTKAYLSASHLNRLFRYVGKTVKVEYLTETAGYEPVLAIQRLEFADSASNPLATLMPLWLKDAGQKTDYAEFCRLVGLMETSYSNLVHEVFSNDTLLQAFLNRPASLAHHHSTLGGLFAHSVEVALDCEQACVRRPSANASLTVAAALLHDIGKCEEYQQMASGKFYRGSTGELEMHKIQGVGIVKLAGDRCNADPMLISEIVHCMSAANGPEYMGLPKQKMLEAVILQTADSRSSLADQYESPRGVSTGWGYRHAKQFKSEFLAT